ncbi:MFS transporter [Candidatus Pantoea multigeneris]|uniref:MFS transporter n=1 Tax=Candidatus Pantoea multigeneris TaxID=2608357 RepID=A0ABX0RDU9_9GAMM|nr:MFS transporter [Pantoea multigeneris]NIF23232.1 MFS transporter [Pantoea multigeneris]
MSRHLSIEDLPLNRFHKILTVRSAGGTFVDGYVLSIIGIVMAKITVALGLNAFWQGLVASSALIGIFFGGFLGGFLTDKLGRRLLYFVGPALFIIFSLLQLWVESGMQLFIYRFMLGVAVGIEYPVASAFLVEFLPKKNRGPRLAGITIIWFVGAAAAYIIGELILNYGGDDAWRWVISSAALFGLILFCLRLGTPESPRWLLGKGRIAEAEQVIKKTYGTQYGIANLPAEEPRKKLSFINLLHSGYGKRMAFVSLFWTCGVIPLFAVYAFGPIVLDALHVTGELASVGTIIITLLFVAGCILATSLINYLGRRNLILHSFFWSGLALLLLGWQHDASPVVVLLLFSAYALFIGGAQVLTLVYPNEIFPTEIRAAAVGVGISMSRIGAAAGTWLVPISLQTQGIEVTMYISAAITFFGLLVSFILAPETNKMDLNDAASLSNTPPATSNEPVTTQRVKEMP